MSIKALEAKGRSLGSTGDGMSKSELLRSGFDVAMKRGNRPSSFGGLRGDEIKSKGSTLPIGISRNGINKEQKIIPKRARRFSLKKVSRSSKK